MQTVNPLESLMEELSRNPFILLIAAGIILIIILLVVLILVIRWRRKRNGKKPRIYRKYRLWLLCRTTILKLPKFKMRRLRACVRISGISESES